MPCTSTEEFDPAYMRCLFDFGAAEMRWGGCGNLSPYLVRPPIAPVRTAPS